MALSHYVLDTSAYSHFQRGDPQVVDLIDSADWLGLTPIVLAELEIGFLLGKTQRLKQNRDTLQEFLASPVVEELSLSSRVSRIYAEIVVALRQAGIKIPTNDVWIAAAAAHAGVSVLTYDNHFKVIHRIGSVVLTPPD